MGASALVSDTGSQSMTAADVKDALRRRHPGSDAGGMVGQWTCIEEWLGIDLLALNAWQKADVIGYEVKVSRSDLRRELLRPDKRADAVARTTEFYFAVPAGLLTADELTYEEPGWEARDFARQPCPGVSAFGPPQPYRRDSEPRYGGQCRGVYKRGRTVGPFRVSLPLPLTVPPPTYKQRRLDETDEEWDRYLADHAEFTIQDTEESVACPRCEGRGYVDVSRVEHEAPTLWVPRDVGLVTVDARGCHVVKRSPRRKDPAPIAPTRKQVNDLVRWVSHRPDPRHVRQPMEAAA